MPAPRTPTSRGHQPQRDACSYGTWASETWLERPTSTMAAVHYQALTLSPGVRRASNGDATRGGYAVGVAGFLPIVVPVNHSWPATWPMIWPPRLRALRLDGAAMSQPPGAFWFAYPRALVDVSGALHVVWAEPDAALPEDPRTLRGELPTLRSVWYATLQSGRWDHPQRIYHPGMDLGWSQTEASRLVLDERHGLHVVFVARDSRGEALVHLSAPSASPRHWGSVELRHPGPIVYVDLAAGSDHRLAIAFVSAIALPEPRLNVLFVRQSTDDGATWWPEAVFTAPAEEPAIEPHVFFDRVSALRLQWIRQPLGTFVGGTVWHATVTSPGHRVINALALPDDVVTSGSEAALDSCGTVHLFTKAYMVGGPELRYARATTEGWSTWMRPFAGPGGRVSIVATDSTVHLIWNVHPKMADENSIELSGLAYSTLPVHRARPGP
jgi:hypothetical protein